MEQALHFHVCLLSEEISTPPCLTSLSLLNPCDPAVPRTPPRNIQVYNPTPNSLNVRWEPATGQVQQYRVTYSPLSGDRPSESVSNPLQAVKTQTVISGRIFLQGRKRWFPPEIITSLFTKEDYDCKDKKITNSGMLFYLETLVKICW